MNIFHPNSFHSLAKYGYVKGSVNMRLLTGLYWMFLMMQVTIASTFMPITQIMDKKSLYPENIIFGKICLQQNLSEQNSDGIVQKYRLNGFIFPIVFGSLIVFWYMKIQTMIKTQCSSFKTFGCYGGKYRRNLQTLKEHLAQSFYWIFFIVMENVLVVFLKMYSKEIGDRKLFIIYNIFFVIFGDIVTGLLLPIKYIIVSRKEYQILWSSTVTNQVEEKSPKSSVKIPRREFTPEMLQISSESSNQKSINKYIYFHKRDVPSINITQIE